MLVLEKEVGSIILRRISPNTSYLESECMPSGFMGESPLQLIIDTHNLSRRRKGSTVQYNFTDL